LTSVRCGIRPVPFVGLDHRLSTPARIPLQAEATIVVNDDEPALRTPSLLNRLIHFFRQLWHLGTRQNLVFHQAAHSLPVEGGIA